LSESTLFFYPLLLTVIVVSLITVIYAQEQQEKEEYSFIDKWDSEGSGDGQLSTPHSIDVDSNNGNVYLADSGNNRVQKFTTDGEFITKWGSKGTENGQFEGLHDVTIDPTGKFVYTLELGNNHRVQKFTADGQFISWWAYEETGGEKSYKDPHQLAIDSSGNVYLPDKGGAKVLKFDSNGKFITKWGSEGTGNSQFKTPHGVAIDAGNNYLEILPTNKDKVIIASEQYTGENRPS
jgi:DNA-binding beta-propeller fold protein YncE